MIRWIINLVCTPKLRNKNPLPMPQTCFIGIISQQQKILSHGLNVNEFPFTLRTSRFISVTQMKIVAITYKWSLPISYNGWSIVGMTFDIVHIIQTRRCDLALMTKEKINENPGEETEVI